MASVSNWEIRENNAANVIFPLCLSPMMHPGSTPPAPLTCTAPLSPDPFSSQLHFGVPDPNSGACPWPCPWPCHEVCVCRSPSCLAPASWVLLTTEPSRWPGRWNRVGLYTILRPAQEVVPWVPHCRGPGLSMPSLWHQQSLEPKGWWAHLDVAWHVTNLDHFLVPGTPESPAQVAWSPFPDPNQPS